VPLGHLAVARVQERITRRLVVDHDPARHAEVQAQDGAVAVGVEEQLLSASTGREQRAAGERASSGTRRETALEVPRIGGLDRHDRASQGARFDQ